MLLFFLASCKETDKVKYQQVKYKKGEGLRVEF